MICWLGNYLFPALKVLEEFLRALREFLRMDNYGQLLSKVKTLEANSHLKFAWKTHICRHDFYHFQSHVVKWPYPFIRSRQVPLGFFL